MSSQYSAGVAERLEQLRKAIGQGCGDHSCRFVRQQGMGTNGGCRCMNAGRVQLAMRLLVLQMFKEMGWDRDQS